MTVSEDVVVVGGIITVVKEFFQAERAKKEFFQISTCDYGIRFLMGQSVNNIT